MANFDIAYKISAKHEGGWVNDPNDDGGETYRGIARNFFPKWPGWPIVDAYKAKGMVKTQTIIKDAQLEALVKEFVRQEIWIKKAKGDLIENQDLANFIFDFCFNSGRARQQIHIAVNKTMGTKLSEDKSAVLTSDSLAILNAQAPKLYPVIVARRKAYLQSLADYKHFGKGWMARVAQFPLSITQEAATYVAGIVEDSKKKSNS
jgi:lysozyme family protein